AGKDPSRSLAGKLVVLARLFAAARTRSLARGDELARQDSHLALRVWHHDAFLAEAPDQRPAQLALDSAALPWVGNPDEELEYERILLRPDDPRLGQRLVQRARMAERHVLHDPSHMIGVAVVRDPDRETNPHARVAER